MIYIVIAASAVGGAEKRFLGLWLHLRRAGHDWIGVLMSDALLRRAREAAEFAEIDKHLDGVETFPEIEGLGGMRAQVRRLWLRDRRTGFHYVHVPPILVHHVPTRRVAFSMTAATWRYTSRRGLVATYAGMIAARHVDVLNAPILEGLRQTLPFRRAESMTLTPHSFVDLDVYRPRPFEEKMSRVCFLGLFSRDKGVFEFVEALPKLDAMLRSKGLVPDYRLMGRDVETPGIVEACAKLRPRIDVQAYEERNPADVLAPAKVFLSLQQTTNYPSKSLLEAMACGALPIVTDVPDTPLIAPRDVALYVPKRFTAEDLAAPIATIFSMDRNAFERRVALGRTHLERNFSVGGMADYYLGIYQRLAA